MYDTCRTDYFTIATLLTVPEIRINFIGLMESRITRIIQTHIRIDNGSAPTNHAYPAKRKIKGIKGSEITHVKFNAYEMYLLSNEFYAAYLDE